MSGSDQDSSVITKLNAMHNDLRSVMKWQEGHDGQGGDTTHHIINEKVASNASQLNFMKGAAYLLTLIGLGNLAAWFGWK